MAHSAKRNVRSSTLASKAPAGSPKGPFRTNWNFVGMAKAKRAPKPLTPGQKAQATKTANGLDLSAIARKAHATRRANKLAREQEIAKLDRQARRAKQAKLTALGVRI